MTNELGSEILIVYTRFPQPGQTKTRLIPVLGAERAADLQKKMAEHTFDLCCELASRRDLSIAVHYEGGDVDALRAWIPSPMIYRSQVAGSLGERLAQSFAQSFSSGKERVIIIGSDCPSLNSEILEAGFAQLHENDLVLGPAHDGGYYLIGLRKDIQFLWQDIDWGTDKVLQQTMEIARKSGLSLALLPSLADIDRPEDLHYLTQWGDQYQLFTSGA